MKHQSFLFTLFVAAAVSAEEMTSDPFPEFADIPKNELVQPGGFEVAPDGSLTVNGEPRYFPATFWYGGFEFMPDYNKGVCEDLKWLYGEMPTYETMSRLGFDATGLSCTFKWLRMYRPKQKEFPCKWEKSLPSFKCGLSLYMDFTASEWGLGSMNMGDRPLDPDFKGERGKWPDEIPQKDKQRKASMTVDEGDELMSLDAFDPEAKKREEEAKKPKGPPAGYLTQEAFTVGHNHWVAYSIVHPKGRRIWLNMWKYGTKEVLDYGLKPWCYELFNEPSVYDTSAYAQQEYKARMIQRFGADFDTSLSGLAKGIEYSKYLEERFASLMGEGTAEIKKLYPQARTTFQPCTIRTKGLDLYRCYKELDVVCSHTGGRGLMEAHMLRGLADGKPIVDNEMYIGNSTNSIRQAYLDQYQRGYNISYSFKWSGDRSGYNFMNRDNVRPDALLGVRLAKRDIMDVNEFLTPRERGVAREVAVLFSNPTERLAQYSDHNGYKFFDQAVVGIDAAQVPLDVLWEEDLTNTTARLERYKMLVIAGADASYPGSIEQIEKWVKKGGLLLCINKKFDCNEYGEKNQAAFTANLTEGEVKVGAGYVKYAPGRMSPQQIGQLAVAFGKRAGIKPCCEVLDAFDEKRAPVFPIEVHPAKRNGMYAWSVTARTMSDKTVLFKPAESGKLMLRVWTGMEQGKVVSYREELLPDANGYYVLDLRRDTTVFLVSGTREQLLKRYPKTADSLWLKPVTAEDTLRSCASRAQEEKAKRARRRGRFYVEFDRITKLDLSGRANATLKDTLKIDTAEKGGDGKIVWGEGVFDGIPMNIIRYDQNNFKDCLLLTGTKSAKAIPVDAQVGNLYILSQGEMDGVAQFEDGTKERFSGKSTGKEPAVWKWGNLKADKTIKAIDFRSANGEPAVLLAISYEKPERGKLVVPGETIRFRGIASKGIHNTVSNGEWNVVLDESATSWSTTGINFTQKVPFMKGRYYRLSFEVNRLPDQWGNYHDHATPQMRINGVDAKGRGSSANWMVPKYASNGAWFYRTDNDPETWEKACFYMADGAIPDNVSFLTGIALQFQTMPAERSGLAFRNWTLEEVDGWVPPPGQAEALKEAAKETTKAPDVRKSGKRRGPGFEAPAADAGLSLDLD